MFSRSLRWSALLALFAVAAIQPLPLHGQTAVSADSVSSIRPAVAATTAPFTGADAPHMVALRLALPGIAVPLRADSLDSDLSHAAARVNAGANAALMITGAAALVIGLVIGGDEGTVIAIGGGAVGLVGLYRFLR